MSDPKDKKNQDSINLLFDDILKIIFMCTLGMVFGIHNHFKKNPRVISSPKPINFWFWNGASFVLGLVFFGLSYFMNEAFSLRLIEGTISIWMVGSSLTATVHRLFISKYQELSITTKDLKAKPKPNFEDLNKELLNPSEIPIGLSFATNSVVSLNQWHTMEHVLVCGATGVGKTSLLLTMVIHSLYHKKPIIIIDPKGDFVDIDLLKNLTKIFGREKDLKIFSLSNPKISCSYNPISIGTPEQIKSKLMSGLDLKHEYYGAVASKVLGTVLDLLDFFNEKNVTLKRLQSLLNNKKELGLLEKNLRSEPNSLEVDALLDKLAALRSLDIKDIAGLLAQIDAFTLREFDGIFSMDNHEKVEINLVDVLQNSQIAYFQMNTNGYRDLSTRLGKLLVQDIKLISNKFQSGQLVKNFEFAGIFIDEFGSFATPDFSDIQKMIRSAHMGLRLFYQGMADLRKVSPEFEDQVLGNTLIKIILRQDIQADVEKWVGMAGTMDTMIESYQTATDITGMMLTGTGNIHMGKKVKIDFDVLKSLDKGEAVIINKGTKKVDLFQIWDAKNSQSLARLQAHFAKSQAPMSLKTPKNLTASEQVSNEIPDPKSLRLSKSLRLKEPKKIQGPRQNTRNF